MEVGALLLAGGSGTRFGSAKQFLELAPGVRLIDQALVTVLAVADHSVLVLPPDSIWTGQPVDAIAIGGSDRLASVRSGLKKLPPSCEIILLHDAAHPLATPATARATIAAVKNGADAAVPWLPLVDVVKRVRPDGSLETVGRDGLGQAQTPHAFRADILRQLHTDSTHEAWEDTQLVEEQGGTVVGVAGDPANIHIVEAADLEVARRLFGSDSS